MAQPAITIATADDQLSGIPRAPTAADTLPLDLPPPSRAASAAPDHQVSRLTINLDATLGSAQPVQRIRSQINLSPGNTDMAEGGGMSILGFKHEKVQRRIIAEDPEWNLAPVEKLSELCVRVIVANFEKNPILRGIPPKYRDRVLNSISVELPLSIAGPLIPDDSYWKRRAKSCFKNCDPEKHGGSWKRLFFELHIQKVLENFVPRSGVGFCSGAALSGANSELLVGLFTNPNIKEPTPEKLIDLKGLEESIGFNPKFNALHSKVVPPANLPTPKDHETLAKEFLADLI
ncbi:T-complex-associated testis-expressed protein 1, partial [Nowakowskiella sp. JEL0078]